MNRIGWEQNVRTRWGCDHTITADGEGGMEEGVAFREAKPAEHGTYTLEAVLLTPVIIGLLLFAVHAGRLGLLDITMRRAAHDAARAATLQLDADTADHAARQTLQNALGPKQWATCEPTTLIDTYLIGWAGESTDQGLVTIRLRCTTNITYLGPLITTTKTYETTAVEAIDEYRSRLSDPS